MQDLLTKGIDENWQIRSEKMHKFKDSPLGRIPEEWEVVKLGKISKINYGTRLSEKEYDVYGNSKIYGTGGVIALSKRFIDIGEAIIIPRKGTINNKFYIKKREKFWVIDTAFYLKTNLNTKFLFYKLEIIDFNLFNEATGVPSLSRNTLNKIIIAISISIPEQRKIGSILSKIDEVIEKEQKYKQKLEKLKRGLMEDLLSGKVRVNRLINEVKA